MHHKQLGNFKEGENVSFGVRPPGMLAGGESGGVLFRRRLVAEVQLMISSLRAHRSSGFFLMQPCHLINIDKYSI